MYGMRLNSFFLIQNLNLIHSFFLTSNHFIKKDNSIGTQKDKTTLLMILLLTRYVRVGSKQGQIGTKWDKYGAF